MLIDTSADDVNRTVTRTEILDAVRDAFDGAGATKSALLATAEESGARPEVVEILRRLPEQVALRHVRELWAQLPELPVY